MKETQANMLKTSGTEVARKIRQYITRRRLRPGDRLPTHEELSRHLKVGPRRLREGLSILKHQHMLETHNKGGTILCQPNVTALGEPISWHLANAGYELADLVAARAYLECGTAGEAAAKRTARDLLVILDTLEQLEAIAETDQSDLEEDKSFHLAIMEASHNHVLVAFGQLIRLQFQFMSHQPNTQTVAQRRAINQEHRHIYDAIVRQETNAARELMYAHVMGQLKRACK